MIGPHVHMGPIKIRKYTNNKCANTQTHKYKVLERPNMCYNFEKQGVQGYQI